LAVAIIVGTVALLAGGSEIAYANVKSRAELLQANLTLELEAGQKELEAGKETLKQANADHDAYWAMRAGDHFAAARARFLAASELADNSRLLKALEFAPGVGESARSRHTAVNGIAAMGAAVSDAGKDLAALDQELLKPS